MKKLIISLILITVLFVAMSARNLQTQDCDIAQLAFNEQDVSQWSPSNSNYGTTYYRSNSTYRFDAEPNAQLNLKDLKADVKVVSWDKDYAEIEILKLSTVSQAELDNCEVWLDNNQDITLSTCFRDNQSAAMISIVLKLPRAIEFGYIYNHEGELIIKSSDQVHIYTRR